MCRQDVPTIPQTRIQSKVCKTRVTKTMKSGQMFGSVSNFNFLLSKQPQNIHKNRAHNIPQSNCWGAPKESHVLSGDLQAISNRIAYFCWTKYLSGKLKSGLGSVAFAVSVFVLDLPSGEICALCSFRKKVVVRVSKFAFCSCKCVFRWFRFPVNTFQVSVSQSTLAAGSQTRLGHKLLHACFKRPLVS